MKKIFYFILLFSAPVFVRAQNIFPASGSAGIGTTTPNTSSAIEIKSTTQGLLIPRMTKAQRDAIASPATGLMIYQTNSTPGFYYFDGTAWQPVSAKGVNKTLSNLSSPTAVNMDLLPDTNNTVNLGSSAWAWKDFYFAGNIYSNGNRFISGDASNTWIGSNTGQLNSGAYNTGTGSGALNANLSGQDNTATGYASLSENTTGDGNVANGYFTMISNKTGSFNCATGNGTLGGNTEGNYNVATGASALQHSASGNGNVADGAFALKSNMDGSYNTGIGDSANVGSGSLTNATAIGAHALVENSDALVLGSVAGVNNATNSVNVGIGLTSPTSSLHIKAKGSTSATSSLRIDDYSSTGTLLLASDDGKVGIGTASPSQKLHVLDGNNSGGSPNANATIVMEKNGASYFQTLTPDGDENGILFGIASNNASGGVIYNTGTTRKGFELRTGGNGTRIRIDSTGKVAIGDFTPTSSLHIKGQGNTSGTSSLRVENSSSSIPILLVGDDGKVGIGTSSPSKKLHVLDGSSSSGGTANANSTIVMERNNISYFQILTPDAYENGILFGTASNSASGGIVYNQSSTKKGFQIRTGGNNTRMRIDSLGRIAFGDFAPSHRLQLDVDDAAKPSTSTWTIASDERLKTNISDFKDGLDLVNKIHPVWFEYNGKAGLPKGVKSVGILAQEMQKIAPYMIGKYKSTDENGNTNEYLDYNANALFYILVNSVKELSKQNDELRSQNEKFKTQYDQQQKVNESLQQQIDELKAMMTPGKSTQSAMSNELSVMSEATLEQNTPNPFNSTTTIHYSLPQRCTSAQVIITDKSGKVLKQVNLPGNGKGSLTVDASTLSSGAYNYTLYVDGKMIGSKQMELLK